MNPIRVPHSWLLLTTFLIGSLVVGGLRADTPPLFDAPGLVPVPDFVFGDVVADFDNDGLADLVLAQSSAISFLAGKGDGTFADPTDSPSGFLIGSPLAIDVDCDLDLDLVFPLSSRFEVYINDGSGTFTAGPVYPLDGYPSGTVHADFNRDGMQDLAFSYGSTETLVLLADADGFTTTTAYDGGGTVINLVAADFDGDGAVDLALNDLANDRMRRLMNNGDGTFAAGVDFGSISQPRQLFSGDFDRDGNVDIVTYSFDNKHFKLYLGNGEGTFGAAITFGSGNSIPTIVTVDYDGDRDLDFLSRTGDSGTPQLYRNNGDGSFAIEDLPLLINPASVHCVDITGDHAADLLVRYSATNNYNLVVALSDGDEPRVAPPMVPTGITTVLVGCGDLNGDGDPDLLSLNNQDGELNVSLSDGLGGYGGTTSISVGDRPEYLTVCDHDGVNGLDVIVSNRDSDDISLLLNDGSGGLTNVGETPLSSSPRGIAHGDFDENGSPDLAVCLPGVSRMSILLNAGSTPPLASATTGVGHAYDQVVAGYFNGDTHLDLAAVDLSNSRLLILRGQGDGTFFTPLPFTISAFPADLVAGDFDNDGDLDVATALRGPDQIGILWNAGNANFNSPPTLIDTRYTPWTLESGDFDGDGDLDLAAFHSYSVDTYLNDGALSFVAGPKFTGGLYGHACDLDGDGALDLLVNRAFEDTVSLFHNLGAAAHQPDWTIAPAALSFGRVEQGASSPTLVPRVKNTGAVNLRVDSIELSQAGADLELGTAPTTATLAPGAGLDLPITLNTTTPGTFTAQLRVVTNDPDMASACVPIDAVVFANTGAPSQPVGGIVLCYRLTAASVDPEGQAVEYIYRWTSDGGDEVIHGPTTATEDTLVETELLDEGEIWTVEVTPTDGSNDGPIASGMVTIIKIEPIEFGPENALKAVRWHDYE